MNGVAMNDGSMINLIRLYCDGELDQEQVKQVEQHLQEHPEDRKLLESERLLRERVGAVMKDACSSAPADLSQQIRERLEAAEPAGYSLAHWFREPRRANVFAVAASLFLVAGAVLFGILGPRLDEQGTRHAEPEQAIEAAASVAGEHVAATTKRGQIAQMIRYDSRAEAKLALEPYLKASLTVFDLQEAGYEFVGAMQCKVPHCERSCHFLYLRKGGKPGMVSVHVVPDVGRFDLGEGELLNDELTWATARFPRNPDCPQDVVMFSDGKLAYLVVACIPDDAEKVVRAMQGELIEAGWESP